MALTPEKIAEMDRLTGLGSVNKQTVNASSRISELKGLAEQKKKDAEWNQAGVLGKTGIVGTNVFKALTSSEQALGKHMGTIAAAPENVSKLNTVVDEFQTQSTKMIDAIDKAKAEGKDTSRLQNIFKTYNQHAPQSKDFVSPEMTKELEKGFWQTAGEVGGVALDVASAGTYGKAAAGLSSGVLGKATKQIIAPAATKTGAFLKGAATAAKEAVPMGVGYGVTSAMQENKSLGETAKSGLVGGLVSGVASGVIGGLLNKSNIDPSKLKQEAVDQYKKGLMLTKEKYKEKADKLIPQLLDDQTWGSKKALLDKANKGIELSGKEYEQLGELQGVIDTPDILKNIDDQIASMSQGGRAGAEKLKAINDEVTNQLTSAKQIMAELSTDPTVASPGTVKEVLDRAKINIVDGLRKGYGLNDVADSIENNIDLAKMDSIDEYSRAVQKIIEDYKPQPISINTEKVNTLKKLRNDITSLQVFNKTTPQAYQQDIRELAQAYGKDLYDSRKAQKTINDSKVLSQVKTVDSSLRELLNTKNPEYEKINKVYHTSTELFDIIEEAKKNEMSSVFGKIKEYLGTLGWGVVGSAAGAATGGLTVLPVATAGLVAAGTASFFKSTWYNSLRAVQKNNLANKLAEMGGKELSDLMIQIYRQGPRVLDQFTQSKPTPIK